MGILDTLLGNTAADASNRAAQDTYAKQLAASQQTQQYASTLPAQYNQIASGYQPYQQAGGQGLGMLLNGLGLGGAGGSQQFTDAYRSLPGYQAGIDLGQRAVTGGANAGHTLQSGGTLKALQRFGQDYEDQKSGNYLNQLSGLSGMGMQATGAGAGLQAQGLNTAAGLTGQGLGELYGSAGTIGQGQVAGAQAQQTALGNLMNVGGFLGGSFRGGRPSGSGSTGSPSLNLPIPRFWGS